MSKNFLWPKNEGIVVVPLVLQRRLGGIKTRGLQAVQRCFLLFSPCLKLFFLRGYYFLFCWQFTQARHGCRAVCRDSFSGTALGCQIIIFLPRREKKADAFPAFFSR